MPPKKKPTKPLPVKRALPSISSLLESGAVTPDKHHPPAVAGRTPADDRAFPEENFRAGQDGSAAGRARWTSGARDRTVFHAGNRRTVGGIRSATPAEPASRPNLLNRFRRRRSVHSYWRKNPRPPSRTETDVPVVPHAGSRSEKAVIRSGSQTRAGCLRETRRTRIARRSRMPPPRDYGPRRRCRPRFPPHRLPLQPPRFRRLPRHRSCEPTAGRSGISTARDDPDSIDREAAGAGNHPNTLSGDKTRSLVPALEIKPEVAAPAPVIQVPPPRHRLRRSP